MNCPITRVPTVRRGGSSHRGQALVEFALVLPVMLLVLLVVADFGRLFLGWVNLQNMARIGANYAAEYPTAWSTPSPDPTEQAVYAQQMQNDASTINCALPSPLPTPAFPDGTAIGDRAQVSLTCNFRILTPVVAAVVGSSVPLSASAVFPVRGGDIALPTPEPTETPTATPAPSASPTPTPAPCTVPDFILNQVRVNDAATLWAQAGFSLPLNESIGNGNYTITTEQVNGTTADWDGMSESCTTFQLTVGP